MTVASPSAVLNGAAIGGSAPDVVAIGVSALDVVAFDVAVVDSHA